MATVIYWLAEGEINCFAYLKSNFIAESYKEYLYMQEKKQMPYVNIKITNEGVTPEKKAELIKGATQLLQDVLGKNPQTTVVVIDEVETDNWGIGGETITIRRKRGQ
ncbi:4-oxalocrotonate tautomerase family protein [Desulfobacula sp.]|uniref:tautomerase family protein n=1 Tax=Desulfobacula sp. TaxID=2593537 RepID=UPI00345B7208